MSKSATAIALLTLALIISNGWWITLHARNPAHEANDSRCSLAIESLRLADRAVVQSFAAIQSSSKPGATRDSIIAAVTQADRADQRICFEDPGVVSAGAIGLQFNDAGRLVGATRAHCPP